MLINATLFRILYFPNLRILNPLSGTPLKGQPSLIISLSVFVDTKPMSTARTFFCLITFSSKNAFCAHSFTPDLCSNILLSDSSWHQFSIKPSHSSHPFPWFFSSNYFFLPSLYGFYVFPSLPALDIKKWVCFVNFTLLWTLNCS